MVGCRGVTAATEEEPVGDTRRGRAGREDTRGGEPSSTNEASSRQVSVSAGDHRSSQHDRPVDVTSAASAVEKRADVLLGFLRGEPRRAGLSRVDDPPPGVNENESLGPCCERHARCVVHLVEEQRKGEAEARGRLVCLNPALVERRLLVEDDAFFEVRRELPFIGRMCLGDVDERKVDPVAETLEESLDIARPATKWRSGETAEHEQQRASTNERCELDRLEVVGASHGDRGEGVSGLERVGFAVAEQARDHRVTFQALGEALDVGSILGVGDAGESAVL